MARAAQAARDVSRKRFVESGLNDGHLRFTIGGVTLAVVGSCAEGNLGCFRQLCGSFASRGYRTALEHGSEHRPPIGILERNCTRLKIQRLGSTYRCASDVGLIRLVKPRKKRGTIAQRNYSTTDNVDLSSEWRQGESAPSGNRCLCEVCLCRVKRCQAQVSIEDQVQQ